MSEPIQVKSFVKSYGFQVVALIAASVAFILSLTSRSVKTAEEVSTLLTTTVEEHNTRTAEEEEQYKKDPELLYRENRELAKSMEGK